MARNVSLEEYAALQYGINSKSENTETTSSTQLTAEKIAKDNLHYLFFVDYYEELRKYRYLGDLGVDESSLSDKEKNDRLKKVNSLNDEFNRFAFKRGFQFLPKPGEYKTSSFVLETTYPGLLVGTGLPHGAGVKGELAIGFTFDYVTGMPYIPGSTVKGILRSGFQLGGGAFVCELLNSINGGQNISEDTVKELEQDIFERETGGDVFFDAYPIIENGNSGRLLDTDNLAPAERTKDPKVLSFLRVKPGVAFRFAFRLTDSCVTVKDTGGVKLSMKDKRELYKRLLCELGVGAKTNVGYGRMIERKAR